MVNKVGNSCFFIVLKDNKVKGQLNEGEWCGDEVKMKVN
jgi:hypothetical protein